MKQLNKVLDGFFGILGLLVTVAICIVLVPFLLIIIGLDKCIVGDQND